MKSFSLQEDKSSAARKLIQPDLVAMSQLLNFDEEVKKDGLNGKVFKISFKEEDASESEEEEVPEVEDEKRKGSRMGEEGTLNLTLEEVRHIRTALTRAELEVGPFLDLKTCYLVSSQPGLTSIRVTRPPLLLVHEQQVWVVLEGTTLQSLLNAHLREVCQ